MKVCFKCKKEKPITHFYKHSEMADGHFGKCKNCAKEDVKINYESNILVPGYIEKERKRGREKYHRLYEGTGKSNMVSNKKYLTKYPEKGWAANKCVALKKPFDGAEKHHWSYNQEHYKDVIWLIKKEHMKAHRFIIYDQERMMYRRVDNMELLNTKEAHQNYIQMCVQQKED